LALLTGAVLAIGLLAACGSSDDGSDTTAPQATGPVPATAADGRGAIRPLAAPTGCTKTARDNLSMKDVLNAAGPGDKVCLLGDMDGARLHLKRSGTAQQPIQVLGDGNTTVGGITVEANYVTISGINAVKPKAPGISLLGTHITLENSTSIDPHEDDGDALRFWGSDITIRHDTLRGTRNANHAHADCMQTFATDEDSPASQRVTIDSNRCEDIDNNCLIVEGPNSEAGDGSGQGATTDIRFTNNYCDSRAEQAVLIDDAQHLTLTGNQIDGHNNHAFALQNNATDATVADNTLSPGTKYEVGADDSVARGYHGPAVGGDP
jgi:hypothetical protein